MRSTKLGKIHTKAGKEIIVDIDSQERYKGSDVYSYKVYAVRYIGKSMSSNYYIYAGKIVINNDNIDYFEVFLDGENLKVKNE